jgi:hypothetical protein
VRDQRVEDPVRAELTEQRLRQRHELGGGEAGTGDDGLGDRLVPRDAALARSRAEHADAEERQHVAHRPVLAGRTVEQRPDKIRPQLPQRGGEIRVDVVEDHLRAGGAQRIGHAAAGAQRDVALVRQASGQDDDAGCGGGGGHDASSQVG